MLQVESLGPQLAVGIRSPLLIRIVVSTVEVTSLSPPLYVGEQNAPCLKVGYLDEIVVDEASDHDTRLGVAGE
jgi:hypothetical protein